MDLNNELEILAPVFPGFYNSIYDFDDDYISDYPVEDVLDLEGVSCPVDILTAYTCNHDVINIRYKDYMHDVSEKFVDAVEEFLRTELHDEINIVFDSISSPAFYNYTNDKIVATMKLSDAAANKIDEFLEDHLDDWCEYLKKNFTSCDGFISFYSNKPEDWPMYFTSMDAVEAQAVLSFIIKTLDSNYVEKLYYDTMDSIWDGEYCEVRQSFIDVLKKPVVKDAIAAYEKECDDCLKYSRVMHEQNPDKDYASDIHEKKKVEVKRIAELIFDEEECV